MYGKPISNIKWNWIYLPSSNFEFYYINSQKALRKLPHKSHFCNIFSSFRKISLDEKIFASYACIFFIYHFIGFYWLFINSLRCFHFMLLDCIHSRYLIKGIKEFNKIFFYLRKYQVFNIKLLCNNRWT